MHHVHELLLKAQKILACPICERTYALEEIRVKETANSIMRLQTVCANNHVPVLTVFALPYSGRWHALPLKTDEVIVGAKEIARFKGNFKKLWNIETDSNA